MEFDSSGVVNPLPVYLKPYTPNLYDSVNAPHYALDCLRGILATLLLFFVIYNLVYHYMSSGNINIFFRYVEAAKSVLIISKHSKEYWIWSLSPWFMQESIVMQNWLRMDTLRVLFCKLVIILIWNLWPKHMKHRLLCNL